MKKKKKSLLPYVVILFLFIGVYVYSTYTSCITAPVFTTDTDFEVTSGMTFSALTNQKSCPSWTYKWYLRQNPSDFELKKGIYMIQSGSTFQSFLAQLKSPVNKDTKITILEGWNMFDIDATLSRNGLIKDGEFLAYIKENLGKYQSKFSFLKSANSLEGFLYPDTYFINPNNFSLDGFTTKLLNNFDTRVMKNIDLGSSENIYKVIKLASIVEKEEKAKSQKAEVAGILKKRVREGWFIGADATVCYPYSLTSNECTPSFIVHHIDDTNGYNTRTMKGLPTTPISNPSFETIEATLDGDDTTPYYYYLHDSQGNIHFARTNAEHEDNKRKYLQ